ncbi:hypothetical protein G7Y89_g3283 [Cudoniella acicularis]|uniref:Uncharacterized protein n=1 Tax=Cudoniella acicularis TaxID=354080 RepID=A0A8H4RRN9_9HELO|nr:hypothetical protein G7Y89_g3283 [Cudoniella acicularis]
MQLITFLTLFVSAAAALVAAIPTPVEEAASLPTNLECPDGTFTCGKFYHSFEEILWPNGTLSESFKSAATSLKTVSGQSRWLAKRCYDFESYFWTIARTSFGQTDWEAKALRTY